MESINWYIRDFVSKYLRTRMKLTRFDYSSHYIKGEGIEIGALNRPLEVSNKAEVKYIDYLTVSELLAQYPELKGETVIEPDIIDNGERLETFKDNSLDFVIANHFIEHCEDPILALKNFCRVLKEGGTLYLGVPDKQYTFDNVRPLTTIEHLLKDHEIGPKWSRKDHYLEYSKYVEKVDTAQLSDHAKGREESSYSIHFHVWTTETFMESLLYILKHFDLPLTLQLAIKNEINEGKELIVILQKDCSNEPNCSATNVHLNS